MRRKKEVRIPNECGRRRESGVERELGRVEEEEERASETTRQSQSARARQRPSQLSTDQLFWSNLATPTHGVIRVVRAGRR